MLGTTNKNIVIKWLVLLGDILAYILLVHTIVYLFPSIVPHTILHHAGLVSIIGVLPFIVSSLILPIVIHKRSLDFRDVMVRNVFVVLIPQALFAYLWHLMTIQSGNEAIFHTVFACSFYCLLIILRVIEKKILGYLRSQGRNTRAVVFVGSDIANSVIYKEIMLDPTTGYNVLGYYSDGEIEDVGDSLKKLGTRDDFRKIIHNPSGAGFGIDELYCSLSHEEDDEIRRIIEFCDHEMIHFYYVPRIFKNLQLHLKPEIMGHYVVFANHTEPLSLLTNKIIKRLFDIVMSVCVLIFMIPFFPIIYLIIKIQSPGPIFFKQKRTGMNGKDFMCYKFRSMHVNNESDTRQAVKDDPRKFPFGNWMRKFNIDELPQFMNVLKGDMSVVGPRPHMILHTEQYSALIKKYMVRHFAKPGITGLAQITGFRGETEELWQMEGRIKKDIEYIENWSFMLDIKIILITIKTFFVHDENAY